MSFTHSNFDCPICGLAEKEIQFYGFSYCNHPICGVCAIKLQKFSKDDENDYDYSKCVICKQDISKIILASTIKQFEDFDEKKLLSDNRFGLLFESLDAQKFYNSIIKIVCPQCKVSHDTINDLMVHMEQHKKRYCELCIAFNKCLHFELDTFTDNDYHQHRYKKHPKCRFCEIRFYDDSHLIKHVKDKHFVCDICHRNQGYVAYNTQNELLKHYAKDHFVCEICRCNNNINVFESDYNLKTHKVSAHAYSLVGEGLVNVGYGDRDNMRYGARRRAREHDDGFFNESAIEIPQIIPTMDCEQEFPRLGAEVATSQQLGTQSLTMDENDARTAFGSRSGIPEDICDKSSKKPAVNTNLGAACSNKHEKMSDNFAISVKRSAGNLNDNDFPSLSSSGEGIPRSGHVLDVSRVVKAESGPRVTAHGVVGGKEEDFPALSSRPDARLKAPATMNSSNGALWKATVKPKSTTKPTQNYSNSSSNRNGTAALLKENDVVLTSSVDRPKVSLMSHEEFQLSNGAHKQVINKTNPQFQSVPSEQDFPILSRPISARATTTQAGAWGRFTVLQQDNINKANTGTNKKRNVGGQQDKFIIDSKSDFPGLPASKSQSVGHVTGKKKGKAGFASVAGSSTGIAQSGRPHVYSMVTPNNVTSASVVTTTPKVEIVCAFEHVSAKQPASLRGIDYIPSVAPIKDPLVVVDSKQFSIMKQAKERLSSSGGGTSSQISLGASSNTDDNFPPMSNDAYNRYNILHIDGDGGDINTDITIGTKEQKNSTKFNSKITSESDFPTLGAPKSTQQKKNQTAVKTPKSTTTKQPVEKSSGSVVSLMDVAMSVAKKNYTPFPDADERNQNMFLVVYDTLDAAMATQFLQLSNLYRNRKLSVKDYLDSLQLDFIDNLDFIARMLPQMCVLLPDIPLQRSLMSSMPKAWIKDLRECTKCDQVLEKTDVTLHNQLAH